nr:cylicin-1-like [Penaeus vannamei]
MANRETSRGTRGGSGHPEEDTRKTRGGHEGVCKEDVKEDTKRGQLRRHEGNSWRESTGRGLRKTPEGRQATRESRKTLRKTRGRLLRHETQERHRKIQAGEDTEGLKTTRKRKKTLRERLKKDTKRHRKHQEKTARHEDSRRTPKKTRRRLKKDTEKDEKDDSDEDTEEDSRKIQKDTEEDSRKTARPRRTRSADGGEAEKSNRKIEHDLQIPDAPLTFGVRSYRVIYQRSLRWSWAALLISGASEMAHLLPKAARAAPLAALNCN